MRTIIDSNEKLRRKRNRDKISFRKRNGSVSRDEYMQSQHELTEDKLWQLKKAIKRYPNASNVRLAEILGVSEGYIRKLKKKLEGRSARTGSRPYIMGVSLFAPEKKK